MLEMIKRKTGLQMVFWRMKNTLEEIEQKRPDRLDYINPMKESLIEIGEAIEYLNHCDKMLMARGSQLYKMELENLKLREENKSLKRQIDKLIEGL